MKKVLTWLILFWSLFAASAYAREVAVLLPVSGPLTSLELWVSSLSKL